MFDWLIIGGAWLCALLFLIMVLTAKRHARRPEGGYEHNEVAPTVAEEPPFPHSEPKS